MSEYDEYYLSKHPSIVPDFHVDNILEQMKVNYGARVFVNVDYLLHDNMYEKYMEKRIANELGMKMLEDKKIKFRVRENPTLKDREIIAETYIFTKEDIYKLLGQFGIHIKGTTLKL